MVKLSFLFILLLCCFTAFLTATQVPGYRVSSSLETYDASGAGYGLADTVRTTYQYAPDSFFHLESKESYHAYYVLMDDYSQIYTSILPYTTTITNSNSYLQIEQTLTTDSDTDWKRVISQYDWNGRRIMYRVFNSSLQERFNERIYYHTNSQPDSVVQGNIKYVFHYDGENRKSRIDCYHNQILGGYYEITYIAPFQHPYHLVFPEDLPFDFGIYTQLSVLTDENWQFGQITYHPVDGDSFILNWTSSINNGLSIEQEEDYSSIGCLFNETGLLVGYFNFYSSGGNSASFSHCKFYWEEALPANDPVQPFSTIKLKPGYPNPFSGNTHFAYQMTKAGDVVIQVYNVKGQLIKTLEQGHKSAGEHQVLWAGMDDKNQKQPSGVYIVKLQAGRDCETVKVILLK